MKHHFPGDAKALESFLKSKGYRQKKNFWISGDEWSLHPDDVLHHVKFTENDSGCELTVVVKKRWFLYGRDQKICSLKLKDLSLKKIHKVVHANHATLAGVCAQRFYSLSAIFIGLFCCLMVLWLGVGYLISQEFEAGRERASELSQLMESLVPSYPDASWYEEGVWRKSLGASMLLSFMMTFVIGIGTALGLWLSESFRVYARAFVFALYFWPGMILLSSLLMGGGIVESLTYILASLAVIPGYFLVMSWRQFYVAEETMPHKKTLWALVAPWCLALLLFVVLIGVKLPWNHQGIVPTPQMGVDSAIIIRDDVLKRTSFGTALSNFYYNHVIAANLFVRRGATKNETMEEATHMHLYLQGFPIKSMGFEDGGQSQEIRALFKDQGFALLQIVGIPLLILWFFFGVLTALFIWPNGNKGKVGSLAAVALLLMLFGLPLWKSSQEQSAIKWFQHRGRLDPLLHKLEALYGGQITTADRDFVLSENDSVMKKFMTPTLFEDLDQALRSDIPNERAMAMASLEGFLAIRKHLSILFFQIEPHLKTQVTSAFFAKVKQLKQKHLIRLIQEDDIVVKYWALHLVVHIQGWEREALDVLSKAIRSQLDHEDLNVRDKAIIALGSILRFSHEERENNVKTLRRYQGHGDWSRSPEPSDYLRVHLLDTHVNHWRLFKKINK